MTSKENMLWQTPDGQKYLEYFQSIPMSQFAVIKVGGELIDDREQLAGLAEDIVCLSALGLYPAIVHGGGPQIDRALGKAGLPTDKIDGVRVTSSEAANIIPSVLSDINSILCSAINQASVKYIASGLTAGVFTADLEDSEDFGSATNIKVRGESVQNLIKKKLVPVISCAGSLSTAPAVQMEQPVNINADKSAVALAGHLSVNKFISLTAPGAVLDRAGNPIDSLTPELARELIQKGVINAGMSEKVEQALELFDHNVHDIVITNPANLLRELFTYEGAGTLVSRDN